MRHQPHRPQTEQPCWIQHSCSAWFHVLLQWTTSDAGGRDAYISASQTCPSSCDIYAAKQLQVKAIAIKSKPPQSEASQCLHGQNQKPPLSNLSYHMSVFLGTCMARTHRGRQQETRENHPRQTHAKSEANTSTEPTTTKIRSYGLWYGNLKHSRGRRKHLEDT